MIRQNAVQFSVDEGFSPVSVDQGDGLREGERPEGLDYDRRTPSDLASHWASVTFCILTKNAWW